MKSFFIILFFLLELVVPGNAQSTKNSPSTGPEWTEADRKYLLDNLIRSKEEIISETKNLTKEQWNFKESPDRWNINQIVEHLAIWELLFMREITVALEREPIPDFTNHLPDSLFLEQDPNGLKKNSALEYTKPFSYAVPLGNNEGPNNLIWLTTMRNESIEYVKKESKNIRLNYICFGANVHQNFLMIFSHTERHLRQLKKVKANPNFPR